MLTRAGATVAAGLAMTLHCSPALAAGGYGGPVTVSGDNHDGQVTTHVQSDGASSASGGAQSGGTGPTCTWVLDTTDNAVVISPDASSQANGGAGAGQFFNVRCSDGAFYPGVFVPASLPTGAGGVSAQALAQEAVNRLPLPLPSAEHNPAGDAVTNLAVWWWVPAAQWRTLSQRTSAGPVWAQVTARPVSSTWDAGDGSEPLLCQGPGRPYDPDASPEAQSPDCSYTYPRSSAGQPQTGPEANDRFFTVRVTVVWQVSWTGSGGTGGVLPPISRTSSFRLRVQDRETVVTEGSG
jgi:hypothetical protein